MVWDNYDGRGEQSKRGKIMSACPAGEGKKQTEGTAITVNKGVRGEK